jgi:hypothetical protein
MLVTAPRRPCGAPTGALGDLARTFLWEGVRLEPSELAARPAGGALAGHETALQTHDDHQRQRSG